jgi:peptide/nickel transport system permease protein
MTVAELAFQEELAAPQEESQAQAVWRRFRRHRLAMIGLTIATLLVFACFIGPMLTPFDSTTIRGRDLLLLKDLPPLSTGPDGFHILGTDSLGRDYLTRLLQGGRVSLALAFVVVILTQVVGTIVGAISGYYGGLVDAVLMRIVDFLFTLPSLPIFMVLYVLIPKDAVPGGSVTVLALVFITLGWTGSSRLVRGMVLSLKNQEFSEAARAVGASDRRIILRHMIPNAIAPVLVAATLQVGGIVVGEAALSYLGFGVQPPDPSWGNMLQGAQKLILTRPMQVFYPGMTIFLTSLSFNFIGDALRDALDPRGQLSAGH